MTDNEWRKLMERVCDHHCRMPCSYYGMIPANPRREKSVRCPLLVERAKQEKQEKKDENDMPQVR
jgi:hypothetical protein